MRYIIATIVLFTTFSCANQTAPTGGPKDEDPPILITSNPADQALNVTEKEIVLEFDEYIKLNKATEQIIISPRIENELEITSRKNIVYLRYKDPLPDSTTFTINLREGVQDITEGNSPENFKLAFSTGPYLDSLAITGMARDRFTQDPVEDYSIFLYDAQDTTTIFEDQPLYFTKTNKEGKFTLSNLKYGTYDIYAVQDQNKNLLLDFKSEAYAFLDSAIILQDTTQRQLTLDTYYLNALPIELKSARQNGTIFEVKYEKYIKGYTLVTEDNSSLYSNFLDEKHRSIIVYNHDFTSDSLKTYIQVTDSLDYTRQDTVYIKYEETIRKPSDLQTNVDLDKIFPTDGILRGVITLNKPVIAYNFDSLYIYLDSTNQIPVDTSSILTKNKYSDQYELYYEIPTALFQPKTEETTTAKAPENLKPKIKEDSINSDSIRTKNIPPPKPHLYIGQGAFVTVDYDSSAQQQEELKFANIEDYAVLFIEVQSDQNNYVVQLLDKSFKVIQEKVNNPDFSFDKISPGEYYVRIILDSNNNGYWDTGDIYTRTLPEELIYYESSDKNRVIVLRANWETPITLEF